MLSLLFSLTLAGRNDIQFYTAPKAISKPSLDGTMSRGWENVPWTPSFIDIRGTTAPAPQLSTRAKMMWDDQYLYIGMHMEEHHLWTTFTKDQTFVYRNNAAEFFFDPDGDGMNYLEYEINPLKTIWSLKMDKPYSAGGRSTTIDMAGVIKGVFLNGTVNDSRDIDRGWGVEMAFPWTSLTSFHSGPVVPVNQVWRMNLQRVNWKFDIVNGQYVKNPETDNTDFALLSVWSSENSTNIHKPEAWGFVKFAI